MKPANHPEAWHGDECPPASFVAGDCADRVYRHRDRGRHGLRAAIDAERYLAAKNE